jgi:WD40 repeat protein
MGAYGSGIGRVDIISSKHRQLCSLVCFPQPFLIDLVVCGMGKRFMLIYFAPGSLDSEAGIYALSYDLTGSRLVTCEADKTIKMWKEDEDATTETHPLNFKPPKDIRRF